MAETTIAQVLRQVAVVLDSWGNEEDLHQLADVYYNLPPELREMAEKYLPPPTSGA